MKFPLIKLPLFTFLIVVCCVFNADAQNAFDAKKPKQNYAKTSNPNVEEFATALQNLRTAHKQLNNQNRKFSSFKTNNIKPLQLNENEATHKKAAINIQQDHSQTPFFITNENSSYQKKLSTESAKLEAVYDFLNQEKATLKIESPSNEFKLIKTQTDAQNNSHFKFAQQYKGIDIWASTIVAHVNGEGFML